MESNKKELFVIENVLNNKKLDFDKYSEIKLYNYITKKMNYFEEFTVEYVDNFNELAVIFSEILKITKRCFKKSVMCTLRKY